MRPRDGCVFAPCFRTNLSNQWDRWLFATRETENVADGSATPARAMSFARAYRRGQSLPDGRPSYAACTQRPSSLATGLAWHRFVHVRTIARDATRHVRGFVIRTDTTQR